MTDEQVTDHDARRTKLRYHWSHRHPIHRALVRIASRVLTHVPFRLKYALTDVIRRRSLPYRLLGSGSVAIQVGAPRDTLLAGRSRAMAFVRRTNPSGRVLVVEPDPASADEFRRVAKRNGLRHVTVVQAAAWFERARLTMEIDPAHPATNFVAGATHYGQIELKRFREITVDALPLDEVVDDEGLDRVHLVSVTTNGAEEQVLRGLKRTLERDRPYVCLARTADSYTGLMTDLGYELVGDDDRGFTFQPRD